MRFYIGRSDGDGFGNSYQIKSFMPHSTVIADDIDHLRDYFINKRPYTFPHYEIIVSEDGAAWNANYSRVKYHPLFSKDALLQSLNGEYRSLGDAGKYDFKFDSNTRFVLAGLDHDDNVVRVFGANDLNHIVRNSQRFSNNISKYVDLNTGEFYNYYLDNMKRPFDKPFEKTGAQVIFFSGNDELPYATTRRVTYTPSNPKQVEGYTFFGVNFYNKAVCVLVTDNLNYIKSQPLQGEAKSVSRWIRAEDGVIYDLNFTPSNVKYSTRIEAIDLPVWMYSDEPKPPKLHKLKLGFTPPVQDDKKNRYTMSVTTTPTQKADASHKVYYLNDTIVSEQEFYQYVNKAKIVEAKVLTKSEIESLLGYPIIIKE